MVTDPRTEPAAANRHHGDLLRVLTLNMQVGLQSRRYRHYVTEAWRHVLPSRGVRETLGQIAALAAGYDVVALQEGDAGSLRSAQLNQIAYVAEQAGHAHWQSAVNRDLRPFAQHCLGCLSREPMRRIDHHRLPGWLPGRGALDVAIERPGYAALRVIIVHLALGRVARTRQLAFLASLVADGGDALVLGDFNGEPEELAAHPGLRAAGLRVLHAQPTYPSWAPLRSIDHVLATPRVEVLSIAALAAQLSDHLPVEVQIRLRPLSAAEASP